jgi:hypothetical protein
LSSKGEPFAEQCEATDQAKSEAFQIPQISRPENKMLQTKIREAGGVMEVMAWNAAPLLHASQNDLPK